MNIEQKHFLFDLGVATSRFAAIPDESEYQLVLKIAKKLSFDIGSYTDCYKNRKIKDNDFFTSRYSHEYSLYRIGVLSFAIFLLGEKNDDACSEIITRLKNVNLSIDIAEQYFELLEIDKNKGFQAFVSNIHECIEELVNLKHSKLDKNKFLEIEERISGLSEQINFAIAYITSDPHGSLAKTRLIAEKLLLNLYRTKMKKEPKKPLIGDMLNDNQFTRLFQRIIINRFNTIRDMGNIGVHGEDVNTEDAKRATDDLLYLINWYLGEEQTNKAS